MAPVAIVFPSNIIPRSFDINSPIIPLPTTVSTRKYVPINSASIFCLKENVTIKLP